MGDETGLAYYEYLAQERIRNLYQQLGHRRWMLGLGDFGIEVQAFPIPSLRFSAGKSRPAGVDVDVVTQLQALMKRMQERHPNDIGTVDEPKRFIAGNLPMFTYSLPRGFGTRPDATPEYIYYGASTQNTLLGLAGPYRNLSLTDQASTDTGGQHISSAIPCLVNVLAKEYHRETRYKQYGYSASTALSFVQYAEEYNRPDCPVNNRAFLATVKLDSATMGNTRMGRRVILATPLYVALAD